MHFVLNSNNNCEDTKLFFLECIIILIIPHSSNTKKGPICTKPFSHVIQLTSAYCDHTFCIFQRNLVCVITKIMYKHSLNSPPMHNNPAPPKTYLKLSTSLHALYRTTLYS